MPFHFNFDKNTPLGHKFGISFLFSSSLACQCKTLCKSSFEMCHMHKEKYKYRIQKKFYTRSYYMVSYLKVQELCIFFCFHISFLVLLLLAKWRRITNSAIFQCHRYFHRHFERNRRSSVILVLFWINQCISSMPACLFKIHEEKDMIDLRVINIFQKYGQWCNITSTQTHHSVFVFENNWTRPGIEQQIFRAIKVNFQ